MIKRKIFTNTIVNILGKFLNYLSQLGLISIIIKSLGKEAYGLIVLILALVGITNMLESGFGLSLTKYIAEYRVKNMERDILGIINTNFVIVTILGTLYSLIIFLLSLKFFEYIFKIPPMWIAPFKNFILIILPLILIEFWNVTFVRIAEGYNRFDSARLFEIVKWLLRLILTTFFLGLEKDGFLGVAKAYLLSGIFTFIFSLYFLKLHLRETFIINFRFYEHKKVKLVFNFGIWMFLAKFFSFISYKVDVILIAIFLTPVNLAYYNIAYKVFEFLSYGYALLTSTLVPLASELYVNQKEKIKTLFLKSTKYITAFMWPVLIFGYFNIDKIINLWMGENFLVAIYLSKIFIISLFFIGMIASGTTIIVGINRVKDLLPILTFSSIANLIISIILIRKIGVYGVVVGTLIGYILITFGYLFKILKILGIIFYDFIKNFLFSLFLIGVFIPLFIGLRYIYIHLLIIILIYFLIWKYNIENEDKVFIFNMLDKKFLEKK